MADPQAYVPPPAPVYSAPPPPPPAAGYGAPYGAAPQWAGVPAASYAGFWKRFLAYLIDGLVLGIAALGIIIALGMIGMTVSISGEDAATAVPAVLALMPLLILVTVAGGWVYFAFLESSPRQGTLGKIAIGIKVTDLAGNRITFGRATGRYFAKMITGLIPFGIGYMMAGFTQKKQALHDMIVSTLVLNR